MEELELIASIFDQIVSRTFLGQCSNLIGHLQISFLVLLQNIAQLNPEHMSDVLGSSFDHSKDTCRGVAHQSIMLLAIIASVCRESSYWRG